MSLKYEPSSEPVVSLTQNPGPGNWDVFLWNEPYTVGGSAGLTVSSHYADLSVRIATEGSVIRDTGLDRDIAWHTTAIVPPHSQCIWSPPGRFAALKLTDLHRSPSLSTYE